MPKVYPYVNTFNAGEVSELIFNREDISKYKSACRVLENAYPLVEGGAKKIPGTHFAGSANTQAQGPVRLVPFQFSTAQGAVLEIANVSPNASIIRIWEPTTPGDWALHLVETSPGVPLQLVSPYNQADLFDLDCGTQSADVLWIFHPNYPPACVERLGTAHWLYSLSPPGGDAGTPPYRGTPDIIKSGFAGLGIPITDITKANPAIVSFSETGVFNQGNRVYINGCTGIVQLNGGEFFLLNGGSSSAITPAALGCVFTGSISGTTLTVTNIFGGAISIGMIVAGAGVSSGTLVTAFGTGLGLTGTYTVNNSQSVGSELMSTPLVDTSAIPSTITYQGNGFAALITALFNQAGDLPACGTFYQERLMLGGPYNHPTTIYGSVQDDYSNFTTDPNQDDYALQFTLVSTLLDQIINMIGTPTALVAGTAGGIWTITSPTGTSLSQSSVVAAKQTTLGIGRLQPQLVGGSAIFVSRSAKTVMFLVYNFGSNEWENYDLTRLNRQITIGTNPPIITAAGGGGGGGGGAYPTGVVINTDGGTDDLPGITVNDGDTRDLKCIELWSDGSTQDITTTGTWTSIGSGIASMALVGSVMHVVFANANAFAVNATIQCASPPFMGVSYNDTLAVTVNGSGGGGGPTLIDLVLNFDGGTDNVTSYHGADSDTIYVYAVGIYSDGTHANLSASVIWTVHTGLVLGGIVGGAEAVDLVNGGSHSISSLLRAQYGTFVQSMTVTISGVGGP